MKSTTLAIIATILPVQMAFAGDDAVNAMDALETLNDRGYVDLGIKESKGRITVFGEKSGKRVSLTYEKDGFDLVKKRVTKVNRNEATDDAGERRLHEAEETTDDAREELHDLRAIGAPADRVHEAEETLFDADEEEEDIREILQANDKKKTYKVKKGQGKEHHKPRKGKGKKKAAHAAVVKRLGEVEDITDAARKELQDLRDVGAPAERIHEAEETLYDAEEEEDDIRAIAKAKEPAKKKSGKKKAKKSKHAAIVERLDEVEKETDAAREELNDLREVGAPADRVHEAEETLYDAEEEEDDIRELAKKAEKKKH